MSCFIYISFLNHTILTYLYICIYIECLERYLNVYIYIGYFYAPCLPRQVFASAVELIATAYLSWIIFGIPVDLYTFIALVLIVSASTVYSMNPIKQQNVLPK